MPESADACRRPLCGRSFWMSRCLHFDVRDPCGAHGKVVGYVPGADEEHPAAIVVRSRWLTYKVAVGSVAAIDGVNRMVRLSAPLRRGRRLPAVA
ncbi:MAG TPA: hypothetical protein VFA44_03320 [Gaiellaceae bacterium]|nr:hypothetical protein [Gaiellaceae bacterium]